MIRICTKDDVTKLTDLAFSKNSIPEHNSAYCCKSYDYIRDDLLVCIENEPHFVLGEFDDDVLVGMAGFFVDDEKYTADCCGPFVKNGESFAEIAESLICHAQILLGDSVKINFFFDKRNIELYELLQKIDATDRGNECILLLRRGEYKPCTPKFDIVPLTPDYEKDFLALHEFIWPDAYISGSEILESDERSVYMITENGQFAASGVLHLPNKGDRAVVEILSVKPECRRRGMGRALLNKLVCESFAHEDRNYVDLVVDNSNTGAMQLYLDFGFTLEVENYSFCK